jgi:hypothetical protein
MNMAKALLLIRKRQKSGMHWRLSQDMLSRYITAISLHIEVISLRIGPNFCTVT